MKCPECKNQMMMQEMEDHNLHACFFESCGGRVKVYFVTPARLDAVRLALTVKDYCHSQGDLITKLEPLVENFSELLKGE